MDFEKTASWIGVVIVTLTVLLFSPSVSPAYELPKTIVLLTGIIALILLILWRAYSEKSITLLGNKLTKPLLVLFVLVLVSMLLSGDSAMSWYGYNGRMFNSFVYWASWGLGFFIFLQWFSQDESLDYLMSALSISITIGSFIALLGHYGLWEQIIGMPVFYQVKSFNLYGSPYLVPLMAILNLLLSSYLYIEKKELIKKAGLVGIIVSLITIGVTINLPWNHSDWRFLFMIAVTLFLWGALWKGKKKSQRVFNLIIGSLVVIIVAISFPGIRNALQIGENSYLVAEVNVPALQEWQMVVDSYIASAKSSLVGSGPDTYFSTFTKHRPLELNQDGALWSLRPTRGGSQVLEMFANWGVLGVLAFVLVIYVLIKQYAHKKQTSRLTLQNRFYFSLLLLVLLMGAMFPLDSSLALLLLLLIVKVSSDVTDKQDKWSFSFRRKESLLWGSTILGSFAGVYVLVGLVTWYSGEAHLVKSLESYSQGDVTSALQDISVAVDRGGERDYYLRHMSQLSLDKLLSATYSDEADPYVQSVFLNQTIDGLDKATTKGERNVINWETAGNLYTRLYIATDGQYYGDAKSALLRVQELDPFNPSGYNALAILYALQGEYELAESLVERSLSLQPAFIENYMIQAQVKELQGDLTEAIASLENALLLAEDGQLIIDQIEAEIDRLEKSSN